MRPRQGADRENAGGMAEVFCGRHVEVGCGLGDLTRAMLRAINMLRMKGSDTLVSV